MRVEMRKEILQIHQRINTTMIYVTHDQVEAMTLGDRICIMNAGEIEQVGAPTTVFNHPASLFVARFIGTPPMNIFEGHLVREGGITLFRGDGIACPLHKEKASRLKACKDGTAVCLGIRPRSLELAEPGTSNAIEATIEISEMLGEEVLLHAIVGNQKLITSTTPNEPAKHEGNHILLAPDMAKAHIFDAKSGKNLTLPSGVSKTSS